MSTWRGADIARAFGVTDEGLVLNGVFCLNTPLGLAAPSLYRGDVDFLQWLGAELPSIVTRLGRLGLSRLMQAPTGNYHVEIDGECVLLSTLETGPTCDPRNAFELFTVAAGLAHVHQQTLGETASCTPDWLMYYKSQRDKLAQLRAPNLSRRALAAWVLLEETWRLCVEESINLLEGMRAEATTRCLTLGLTSFADFVYLADRHLVHYNPIVCCRIDSPAVDIARLLASAGGEVRVAHNMLLSYQRVRRISPLEGKKLLAHLWFPREVDLDLFVDQSANPLSLQRAYNLLQDKIGMISELEDILLASGEEAGRQGEKEVLDMSEKKADIPKAADNQNVDVVAEQTKLAPGEEVTEVSNKALVLEEQQESPQREVEEPAVELESTDQQAEQEEFPRIHMEAITTKEATVWGPFPRPLGAPVELALGQLDQLKTEEASNLVQEAESETSDEPE